MTGLSLEKHAYWQRLAAAYDLLESPLRPSAEDIHIFQEVVGRQVDADRAELRCLLLGATPDLASMRWPHGTRLIGADNSLPMMRSVWPGDVPGMRLGVCANWRHLPLSHSSVHVAVGDGSLNCVRHPEEAHGVCRALNCALGRNGLLVLRCYIRPEEPEGPEQVFDDMFRGRIPTFTQFRFRLFLAMPQDLERGAAVNEVYRLWASHDIDPDRLAVITGWSPASIATMEGCRNSATVHTFPTLAEFRSLLHSYFDEAELITPRYVLGHHTPILVLRSRLQVSA